MVGRLLQKTIKGSGGPPLTPLKQRKSSSPLITSSLLSPPNRCKNPGRSLPPYVPSLLLLVLLSVPPPNRSMPGNEACLQSFSNVNSPCSLRVTLFKVRYLKFSCFPICRKKISSWAKRQFSSSDGGTGGVWR